MFKSWKGGAIRMAKKKAKKAKAKKK